MLFVNILIGNSLERVLARAFMDHVLVIVQRTLLYFKDLVS